MSNLLPSGAGFLDTPTNVPYKTIGGKPSMESGLAVIAGTVGAFAGIMAITKAARAYFEHFGAGKGLPKDWTVENFNDKVKEYKDKPIVNKNTTQYTPHNKRMFKDTTSFKDVKDFLAIFNDLESTLDKNDTDELAKYPHTLNGRLTELSGGVKQNNLRTLTLAEVKQLMPVIDKEIARTSKLTQYAERDDTWETFQFHYQFIMSRLHLVIRSLQYITGESK